MRFILLFPFLLVLVLFALSNPAPVHLGFWPTDFGIDVPMSLAILVGMGLAFVLGGFFVWFSALGQRRRARRAEARARALDQELTALRVRLSQAAVSSTGLVLPPPS